MTTAAILSMSLLAAIAYAGEAYAVQVERCEPTAYRAVFAPDQPLVWTVELRAAGARPAGALHWRLHDLDDREVAAGDLAAPALEPQATATLTLDAGRRPPGWWRLSIATVADTQLQPTRYAVVMPPTRPKDLKASRFGLNAHGVTDDEREMELFVRQGAGWVRGSHLWHEVQAWKPGEDWHGKAYNWSKGDAALARREAVGLSTMGSFGFSVACASSKDPNHKNWWGQSFTAPDDRSDSGPYYAYVKAAVERYRGRIAYWEQWNEPDLDSFYKGSASAYAETLAAAFRAGKAADAEVRILNGGWSGSRGFARVDDMLKTAASVHDVAAFHDYNSPIAKTQAVKRAYRRAGVWPRPLWNTECGKEPSLREDRPLDQRLPYYREQAAEMVRAMTVAAALGVERTFWFCWAWEPFAMHVANGPRPVAGGYRALADLIDAPVPAKPLGTVDLGAAARGTFAFAFERPDGLAVVAWRDPAAARFGVGVQTITLPIDAGAVVVVQGSDGRTIPAKPRSGMLELTLADEPLLIRADGACAALRKAIGWTRRYASVDGVLATADFGANSRLVNLDVEPVARTGSEFAGRVAAASDKKDGKSDRAKFYVFCKLPTDLAWERGDEFGLPRTPLRLRVTHLDNGKGAIGVQYGDGREARIERGNTGTWKTSIVELPEGGSGHSFSYHSNFRLCSYGWSGGEDVVVERIELLGE